MKKMYVILIVRETASPNVSQYKIFDILNTFTGDWKRKISCCPDGLTVMDMAAKHSKLKGSWRCCRRIETYTVSFKKNTFRHYPKADFFYIFIYIYILYLSLWMLRAPYYSFKIYTHVFIDVTILEFNWVFVSLEVYR